MSEPKPVYTTRCHIGMLLWCDIDEEIHKYNFRPKMTGNASRNDIRRAVEAYFAHKNGARGNPPCIECGGHKMSVVPGQTAEALITALLSE